MERCLILACGGTGGHIFPAFSVAEELKKKYPSLRLVYVCGNKDIENAIFRMVSQEKVIPIDSAPFRGARSFFNGVFLLKLAQGFYQAFTILRKEKPAVVVGFGGHFSFPMILMARGLGIKTMIHEQNVMPGFANKVLTRWADAVALSFEDTRKYLPPHRNMRETGNPIRAAIDRDCRQEALGFFGFSANKVTVLVLGGSQGAESINTVFLEALSQVPVSVKSLLQVVHLTGKMSTALAEETCMKEGVVCRAFSFFERMELAYGAADFAVGRAGATFLAEAKAKKMPAILVPYPFAGGHQLLNAKAFVEDGRSLIIHQSDLSPVMFAPIFQDFVERAMQQKNKPIVSPLINAALNSRIKLMTFIEECAGWI